MSERTQVTAEGRRGRAIRLFGESVQTRRERYPLGSPRHRRTVADRLAQVLGACNAVEASGCRVDDVDAGHGNGSAVDVLRAVHADMSLGQQQGRMTLKGGLRAARTACEALRSQLRASMTIRTQAIGGGAACDGGSCDRTPSASYTGTGAWLPLGANGSLVRPYTAGTSRTVCAKHEEELHPMVAAGALRRTDEAASNSTSRTTP